MNDIQIHPDGVRGSAKAVQDTADQTGPAAGHWLDASLTVAQAEPVWQSAGALTRCTNAWQSHLDQIVGQLQACADQLKQSADSYDAANHEAANRFVQALTDLTAS
ncbi:type VII secretion target [Kitasatospora azatica]|uniref:type VII secretion target n=1 Tax=Kitasatospora azatica TaxID=58347 RepID=UPI00056366D0|nr:type VII secretion target [Kitasatospora azatica]